MREGDKKINMINNDLTRWPESIKIYLVEKTSNTMKGSSKRLKFRELTVGASQSTELKNSILEWPMMNCDGFRPIARTWVGRIRQHGWQRGNNFSSLIGMRGFIYFKASAFMCL